MAGRVCVDAPFARKIAELKSPDIVPIISFASSIEEVFLLVVIHYWRLYQKDQGKNNPLH